MNICSIEDCEAKVYARGWCNKHYLRWFKHGDVMWRPLYRSPNQPCAALECKKKAVANGYCQKHDRRNKLYGDPLFSPVAEWGEGTIDHKGYHAIHLKDHPLAYKDGKVLIHRVILFDAIGPGEHKCHWCPKIVCWENGTLQVDHLDWNKLNNVLTNLVPSCGPCNNKRRPPTIITGAEAGVLVQPPTG